MQAQESQIKSLHEQASSHYLRGEFQEALAAWRSVIDLDPEDERAREGVRLCEVLVEEGPAAAAEEPPAQPPAKERAESPFSAAAEGFDRDLDELDEILETGLGSRPATEKPAAPSEGEPAEEPAEFFDFSNVPEVPEPSEGGAESATPAASEEEIDLGAFAGRKSLPVDESTEDAGVIERHSQAVDLPEEESPPADGQQEAAAAELRSRVNELLAEALTAYEQDHKEEALSILARIFILDENNHAALALHDNIRTELESEQAGSAKASDVESSGESAGPSAPEAEVEAETADEAPALADDDATPDDRPRPSAPARRPVEAECDEVEEPAAARAEPGRRRRLLGEDLLTRQNVMVAAALVVVVCVGGFLAFTFMGGADEPAEARTEAASMTRPAAGGPAVAVVLSQGEGEPAGTSPPDAAETAPTSPAPPPQDAAALARQLEGLLAQAGQAMQGEDWAAAVLAFNQALEIDPANPAARDGLAEAGERYREQKAQEQRHQDAIEAFNDGNYRAALTLFYRLPPGESGDSLDRYKRNGWYNMGIQALVVGDCASAATHLQEARSIDPEDREILLALDLAKGCPYSRDTEAYRTEVRQLPLRGLDD